jgi:hypothetical protein
MGRNSSVGTATRYGLDGPGSNPGGGRERKFPHPSRPALGPIQPPIRWLPVSLLGVKRPGRCVNHPPPSMAQVKERVQLYLYSLSALSWPVYKVNFTVPIKSTDESPLPLVGMQPTLARVLQLRFRRII